MKGIHKDDLDMKKQMDYLKCLLKSMKNKGNAKDLFKYIDQ